MPLPSDVKLTDERMPRTPTEAMRIAARDWSYQKYGKPIGNDAADGCWTAMYDAHVDSARNT